ncbi:histidine phosphatase family protein [Actinomycetospora sp. NBRC 106378]|uniref:histidine phosphatase family protein n=1 Tax=Actinomycetospora sp. NBRC 106378 TaxID=3032208 RepID=UPI0024A5563C|nr:histidine phosphatase family protein [Actinomycetospora sp. NBRC 106378]GLZ55295.1 phosphoglycerate mutase [Actinomycetospora sp. NBRC 106378]
MVDRIVLLRHGRTAWNAERRMQGRLDPPLDGTGAAQAEATAPGVRDLGPVVVLASDQARAWQTAAAATEGLDVEPRKEPRLRETDVGQWQGLVDHEVEAGWPGGLDAWRGDAHFHPPGGESRHDAYLRALPVVHELLDADLDGTALLVAHGGVILALTCGFLGLPAEHWGSLAPLGNCRAAVLEYRIDRWRLARWGAEA